jgi:AcrR family transcriptional regulator
MGIKERKRRDVKKMRQSILRAAMKLFAKGGYKNVSMRRIAKKIEYSPGTIYLYFENKDDIMLQLCYQGFESLLNLQHELDRIANPRTRLNAAGRYYIDFALENPELYELMFATEEVIKQPDPEEESVPLRSFRKLEQHVREWLDAGVLAGGNPEAVTISLWAALHGLASLLIKQQLRFLPEEKVGEIVDRAIDFSLRGSYEDS